MTRDFLKLSSLFFFSFHVGVQCCVVQSFASFLIQGWISLHWDALNILQVQICLHFSCGEKKTEGLCLYLLTVKAVILKDCNGVSEF
ncbi:hypothetical protein VNO80_06137 [Phaseolus coccineus]|uniref:Uncharacterized protein n=1 Tax=Phaseolus coccineus TaxID=3886 RepID=A0AAN9NGC4_PHACN